MDSVKHVNIHLITCKLPERYTMKQVHHSQAFRELAQQTLKPQSEVIGTMNVVINFLF